MPDLMSRKILQKRMTDTMSRKTLQRRRHVDALIAPQTPTAIMSTLSPTMTKLKLLSLPSNLPRLKAKAMDSVVPSPSPQSALLLLLPLGLPCLGANLSRPRLTSASMMRDSLKSDPEVNYASLTINLYSWRVIFFEDP